VSPRKLYLNRQLGALNAARFALSTLSLCELTTSGVAAWEQLGQLFNTPAALLA